MPSRLLVDLPFVLIQQLRLAHALTESRYEISVPPDELAKFSRLRECFGVGIAEAAPGDFALGTYIAISHESPRTAIGGLERPLIFPRAIAVHCRRLWPTVRPHRFSFAGLLTESRARFLDRWSAAQAGGPAAVEPLRERWLSIRRRLGMWRGRHRWQTGDLTVFASERGRHYPTKAWDSEYYAMLANSQFVLCPSGDFVWSYRFFEAILCGAIPIVEETCAAYDGFRFHTASPPARRLIWSWEVASYNYELCCQRLTLPERDLSAELSRLPGIGGVHLATASSPA